MPVDVDGGLEDVAERVVRAAENGMDARRVEPSVEGERGFGQRAWRVGEPVRVRVRHDVAHVGAVRGEGDRAREIRDALVTRPSVEKTARGEVGCANVRSGCCID
jgi:hypothetical protein